MNRKKMKHKSALAIVSGLAALALAATCGSALAMGHHGHHHGGDMEYGMLAHAAGVSGQTIHSTFKNDSTLKSDFQNLRAAKKAVDACIISGASCTSQITAYASAQSALTQQKLNDWQTIFAGAPNKGAATSLKSQLDDLNAKKHQLLKQAFNSSSATSATSQSTQQ
jgi:hypothetical protein